MLARRVLVREESVDSYTRTDCCLTIGSALQAPPAHSHPLRLRSSWRCRVCDARILRLMEDHVSGFGQVSLESVKRLHDCDEKSSVIQYGGYRSEYLFRRRFSSHASRVRFQSCTSAKPEVTRSLGLHTMPAGCPNGQAIAHQPARNQPRIFWPFSRFRDCS